MTLRFFQTQNTMRHILQVTALSLGAILPATALAQSSATISLSTNGASASGSAEAASPTAAAPTGEVPYMERYKPEAGLWELGLFGGLMFPSSSHNLVDPERTQQPFDTAGELGARFAYFPRAYLGLEVEAAAMPSSVEDGSTGGLFAARGHLIGQLPVASITPFVLLGMGALGGSSDAMGADVDPAVHFGIGAKAALDEYISVRLDLRDTMTQKVNESQGTQTHHPEVLLGLSFTLERNNPDSDGDGFADHRDDCKTIPGDAQGCPPADQDADGVPDEVDQCKDTRGVAPTGCRDSDGDGIIDPLDACPNDAADTKTGCPDKKCDCIDSDGDGKTDAVDKCPNEAAPTPDGCLVKDADNDGIFDAVDKCPTQPETKNGYEDKDGCPDEVPAEIQKFSGVIRGIEFPYNSAEIRPVSKPLLDEAAKVLKQYEDLRLEISGHTDSQGTREVNVDLSRRRAESVKAYLVSQGIDASRLETRGAGPDEPVADNKTEAGRQQNRRIEFKNISK